MGLQEKNNVLRLCTLIFVLVALVHLLRLILGWDMILGNWESPQWVSIIALIVASGLAWWTWTTSHGKN
ncbi:TPA: hypothetical protein HA249_03460 [Candidatus Woesearchaeota archaeon]|nr:MAG: hypothetical protein QT07_C0008G0017 [archaeon GW2011_AR16]HIG95921.1 hypothetical protein [Candidatus Woesearchaeota archaeon]HIH47096.1 hypothetical protein [Candidatus Woesearchaeota archaeon]HII89012.1 hypothetical protein [Candidatus Woesearchaeota archaeon]